MKNILGGNMKRTFFAIIALLGFGIIALSGCGSGPGSPGEQGSGDTGVMLDSFITPTYNGANTSSVDAFRETCSSGKLEVFADHQATVTINSRLLNPNTSFTPGTLYVEKYTIQYRRDNDSIGAPPIQSDTRFNTIVITPPIGTATNTITATVEFLDLIRKDQYAADILSKQYTSRGGLNNYTAIYTFEGQNQFGTKFSFTAEAPFQIGDFDFCQ
jgi:hypothetical protein